MAAIAVGALKAFSGLAKAAAMALCTTGELASLGVLAWLAVGVALAGAAIGATWGLTGVVLGVAAGWLALLTAHGVMAARHLR